MSMLQASGRVNKTLVVAIALAGGGVMLYYGYTKLKSKKSRGPPTTRKLLSKESKDKGAESGPLKASGSGDTASQVHAPSTDRAEESIVEECSRPTCEIKPRDKIKLETGPETEKETTVTSPLSESSFERAYLTKQAQLHAETSVSQPESLGVEELSGPQSESPGESFEKISLSQVESDLSKQKLETADTAGDSQQSVLEAADTVADPQQSLLEAADTAVDTVADTVADIGDDTAADTASEPQQLLLEAADAAADSQQSLQSSAYEKLSLSQFQSAGDTTSDEDKSAYSEGSGPGQSEGATSSEPSVQDVQSSLGASHSHHDV